MIRARIAVACVFAFALAYVPICAPLAAADDPLVVLIGSTNATRARAGLPALAEDRTLDRFAAAFARRMSAAGTFGHTLPDGTTFADRLRAAHVRFRWAAENLAEDGDVRRAQAELVASPAHYANMTAREAHRIGAAVLPAGGQILVVEEFSD